MPSTNKYSLPYPSLASPNNPPYDFQQLAESTEKALSEVDKQWKRIELPAKIVGFPKAYLLTDGKQSIFTMPHWGSQTTVSIPASTSKTPWKIPTMHAPAYEVSATIAYGKGIIKIDPIGDVTLYAGAEISENLTLSAHLTWIAGL